MAKQSNAFVLRMNRQITTGQYVKSIDQRVAARHKREEVESKRAKKSK